MDSVQYWLLILGMALVTYIPRAIPAVAVDKLKFGPKVQKFLKLIPYTAMTALIFPGIFLVDGANPIVGIVGALTAMLLAWRKCPVIVCVLAAIAVNFLIYLMM